MKIAVGSDHAGYALKEKLKLFLGEKTLEVVDCGPARGDQPAEYVPIARAVAEKVASAAAAGGILVCGTGIGMSIAANKVPGIRAGVCNELFTAKYAKSDVDINVLCLGSRVIGERLAEEIAGVWLDTAFAGGRFAPRIQQLRELEQAMRDAQW